MKGPFRRVILSPNPAPQTRDSIARPMVAAPGHPPVEWAIAEGLTPYAEAVAFMEARA